MTRVLLAPDKFKGSLTATEVAAALERGLAGVAGDVEVAVSPVADGGDGTLDAAVAAGYERVDVRASGPTGEPVDTAWAHLAGTAIVEMADVSGLVRLPGGRLEPMTATSRGTGELIAAALDAGVRRIVLGVGGSACTDGGAGLLQALGARLLDPSGAEIGDGGGALAALAAVDLGGLHPRLREVEVVVACDVDNPLTGPHGAAAIYGPQKGANEAQVAELDAHLGRLADLVSAATGRDVRDVRDSPGAGAAGGVGFAAMAVLGATLRPGIDLVLEMVGFEQTLAGADLVVVGEGALDEQSLRGKAPIGVARLARAAGARVVAVCGVNHLSPPALAAAGIDAAYAVVDRAPSTESAIHDAATHLEQLAADELPRHL
ncbi:glycerate kinase [Nocardioides sp. zg-1228]|uniref:glycerate kinase n=1 Tax=Nocardioides sp. zg-1228 TaxID=2763008 RepID=UPI00164267D3|nr:glycerate kinase [Nocardioides sp. zg-1228]MBC2931512.1 glycerate kinase [Nocardioides sp. zg-1228]QSF57116.1 glycerate kinase [Nocardioides sp. zg-1228]